MTFQTNTSPVHRSLLLQNSIFQMSKLLIKYLKPCNFIDPHAIFSNSMAPGPYLKFVGKSLKYTWATPSEHVSANMH